MLENIIKIFNGVSSWSGVEWAPLQVPLRRRLQTLATAVWTLVSIGGELTCIILYLRLLYSSYWWLAWLYGFWIFYDAAKCRRGGRKAEWTRNLPLWRYYCDYFPMELVKTVDLDPTKNYLFACYPHGLTAQGAVGSFATNALDFYKKFPGMTVNFVTIAGNFFVPFFRDFTLGLGVCSCEESSLLYLLDKRRYKGKCVAMMIGGSAEALDSHSGQYKIVLRQRKGFVRIAMKSGASLVPVFSFGEPDTFRTPCNPKHSVLRRTQEWLKTYTGIPFILPMGRGLFQYSFGLMPYRTPITVVVGAPLEVQQNLYPSEEEIDGVHTEFTNCLIKLFESEKKKYLKNSEDVHLTII